MEVKYTRLFEKDFKAISEKRVILKVDEIIGLIKQSNSISDIADVKKLKGHKDCFRIRIGSYRLGIQIVGNMIWLSRLMLRKDIYKYFP